MDDLLNSDPAAFKSLRVFQSRSFIQFGEKENAAFKSELLRLNENFLDSLSPEGKLPCHPEEVNLESGLWKSEPLSLRRVLRENLKPKETLIEAGLISALVREEDQAVDCFGRWDFITRQIPASPFKPIGYMDRIDVFGWRFIPDVDGKPKNEPRFISKYLLIEIKQGRVTDGMIEQNTNQLMKYVEWVCQEYAHGDYSMIEAFLVASDFLSDKRPFSEGLLRKTRESVTRSYVRGHEAISHSWANVKLVAYSIDKDSGEMSFEVCHDFSELGDEVSQST